MSEQHVPPNAVEIRTEIDRLKHAVQEQNLGVTDQEAAERSLRFARALLAAPLDAQLVQIARALLADLRHLVNWHDQLGSGEYRQSRGDHRPCHHATAAAL